MSLLRRIEKGNQPGGNSPQQGGGNNPPAQGGGDNKSAALGRRVAVPTSGGGADKGNYIDLKSRVQTKLLSELSPDMDTRSAEVRSTIEELFSTILAEENIVLSRAEKTRLFESIIADILGFGPIEVLLADETITEIMVNGPKNVYIEQKGRLSRSNLTFENDDNVLRVLDRIVAPLRHRIDQ